MASDGKKSDDMDSLFDGMVLFNPAADIEIGVEAEVRQDNYNGSDALTTSQPLDENLFSDLTLVVDPLQRFLKRDLGFNKTEFGIQSILQVTRKCFVIKEMKRGASFRGDALGDAVILEFLHYKFRDLTVVLMKLTMLFLPVARWWRRRASLAVMELIHFFLQIHFVLLISRQGKVRLTKWYSPYSQKERSKIIRELCGLIISRAPKLCNFVEWKGFKVVYKRYASLYFCICNDEEDNELETLAIIHHFVETLDRYFGSVCELDLIFNFHKAYFILDEILIAGAMQETSKRTTLRLITAQEDLVEVAKMEASSLSNIIAQATK
ncbi:uncharacterized protein LOC106763263 [Vigna radiata var. radiata]|uniref:Adaptor AP-1 19 kDa protein n=1 Tax=Vigna radiata var. radiata TaxID=3916 RepID=A0A3Q0F0A2_VIGRR|nr:uncharacterized protein LOC106763263 [Vigna radiata var. radiata]